MKKTLIALGFMLEAFVSFSQKLDKSFTGPVPLKMPDIFRTIVQPDGKILFSGHIDRYGNTPVKTFVRLLPDGTLDKAFNFNPKEAYSVSKIARQSNGNTIVMDWSSALIVSGTGEVLKKLTLPFTAAGVIDIEVQSDDKIIMSADQHDGSSVVLRYNADGTQDLSFKNPVANRVIGDIKFQGDKILISGNFSEVNGKTKNDIARLTSDGAVDETFDTGSGTPQFIQAIAIQADGKIYSANTSVRLFNGQQCNGVVRLNPDGSVDNSFKIRSLTGPNGQVHFNGDKILIATYYNGQFRIAQFNQDGSMDAGFSEILLKTHTVFDITTDGIIVCNHDSIKPFGISKYTFNGSLIDSFEPELAAYGSITHMDFTTDNKIIVGGKFIKINDVFTKHVARLLADGTIDTSFSIKEKDNRDIFQLKTLPDNQVLVSSTDGFFKFDTTGKIATDFNFKPFKDLNQVGKFYVQPDQHIIAVGPKNIYRLKPYGSEDPAFDVGTGSGIESHAYGMDIQSSGKVIYGGAFKKFNGMPVNKLVRLDAYGRPDPSFNIGKGPLDGAISEVNVDSNDNIIINGTFSSFDATITPLGLVKLSANGSLDTAFVKNLPKISSNLKIIKTWNNRLFVVDGSVFLVTLIDSDGKKNENFKLPKEITRVSIIDNIAVSGINAVFVSGKMQIKDQQEHSFFCKIILTPVIQNVTVPDTKEDTPFTVSLSQIVASDIDNKFPENFSLSINPGPDYKVQGSTIVPDQNYNGPITASLTIKSEMGESLPYYFNVNVTPVNDPPTIKAVKNNLSVNAGSTLDFAITDITVDDPDNIFPDDFTFSFVPGNGYTIQGNQVVADIAAEDKLMVNVVVNDGEMSSEPFAFPVQVNAIIAALEQGSYQQRIAYPNPANDYLVVKGPISKHNAYLMLKDSSGNTIIQQPLNTQNHLYIQNLSSGCYFLEIKDPTGKIENLKIVKQ
jgi:uncharacterized delta-60 repeat protein